jgi:hypothetical protein
MPLYDIGYLSVLVRHHDGYDGSSVVGDSYFVTLSVPENEQISFLTV